MCHCIVYHNVKYEFFESMKIFSVYVYESEQFECVVTLVKTHEEESFSFKFFRVLSFNFFF